jgi:hypothetical protein
MRGLKCSYGLEACGPLDDRALISDAQDTLHIDNVAGEDGVPFGDPDEAVSRCVGSAKMHDLYTQPSKVQHMAFVESSICCAWFGSIKGRPKKKGQRRHLQGPALLLIGNRV